MGVAFRNCLYLYIEFSMEGWIRFCLTVRELDLVGVWQWNWGGGIWGGKVPRLIARSNCIELRHTLLVLYVKCVR